MKKYLPHLLAYAVFFLVAIVFFYPRVFEGKQLAQGDNVRARGSMGEINQYRDKGETAPLWTNSMFAGMPAYQIFGAQKGNFTTPIYYGLLMGKNVTYSHWVFLVAMLLTYLLLINLNVDWRIAMFGAIAYGISSYNVDLAEAGHSSKLMVLAYLPGVLMGAVMAYKRKYLLGAGVFALILSLSIYANHLQITYYTLMILVILGIVELVKAARSGEMNHFIKASAFLVLGGMVGVLSNTSKIWPTYEYSKETIRGKSELTSNQAKGDGLDRDYIFAWSYGIKESLTLLIPQFMGGGTSQHFRGTAIHKQLFPRLQSDFIKRGYSRDAATKAAEQQVAALFYYGDQPFVGMAIYFGAVVCFLFVMALFLVSGTMRVWLVASALLMISIAWGKNFFLNDIWLSIVPMFNKFRSVSMALGLAQLCFIVLGALGLQRIFDPKISVEAKKKAMLIAAGITGGICLLVTLISFGMSPVGARDSQIGQQMAATLMNDRTSILRMDALRSLFLILISAGLIWAYLTNKIKALVTVLGIGLLMVLDIWSVDRRVMFAEKFETKKELSANIEPLPVDKQIQADPDPHFRVLDVARGNPFTNANTSYFHKSMGGYHAAKLMRFNDLVDRYLSNPGPNMHLFGMFNTKYIIQGEGAAAKASINPKVLGNAWFVDEFKIVEDGDAEMDALASFDPAKTAIVQKSFAQPLEGFQLQPDSTATIKLVDYHPDNMKYEYTTKTDQLAVFSEMYYPPSKGWNLYLDGTKTTDFTKVNFALRAARLPAGSHTLEMKFEPTSFYLGETISKGCSLLTLLLFLGGLVFFFRKEGDLPDISLLHDMEEIKEQKVLKKTTATKKKGKK